MKITIGMFAIAVALCAAPANAQPPARLDARWTPYLGCWRLLGENVHAEGTASMTVCVRASGATTGVAMTTFADGKRILEQTVVADGVAHPVAESNCTGTQTSQWSRDGLRLFTHVDLACNDRPAQAISGLTLFAQGPAWIDIQATPGDQQQVRIRRYVRALDQPEGLAALPVEMATRAAIDARAAGAHTLSQEDVAEASGKVASPVVEAAIVETEARFALDSRALRHLADAGVWPNVIDLMVAQSFPAHFGVERPVTLPPPPVASATGTSAVIGAAPYPAPYPFYPYGAYDPYYYYSYYYSPFAYPYYWGASGYYRGPTYYISNGNTVVVPNGSGDNGQGQVINGRGYTRVHPASSGDTAQPAQHVAAPAGTARGASATGAAPSSDSSGSSTSSGSGGLASGSGYSSGGGGGTGRTAQPK